MTLIVSLRIPDGIVLAGDSLATMMSNLQVQADFQVTCPECGHQHTEKPTLPGIAMPTTTLSYAQKVFPFLKEFGVGTSGAGQLAGKTMYFAMRELESELINKGKAARPKNVTKAAEIIFTRARELLVEQVKLEGKDIEDMGDDWYPLGFQVVGYDGDKATTVELKVGKAVQSTTHNQPGITATGQTGVVEALFGRFAIEEKEKPSIDLFSLQDAIAYAEFLITTTASHQRFAKTIPGVGGEIDVALVTPFDQFKWIRQKTLQSKISGA